MKSSLVCLMAILGLACGQYNNNNRVNPANAAILQEARYQMGDGSFGAAYLTDDGTEFKEETTSDGTRKGSYSYIGDDGKKITVNYIAGKMGFQVTGDHLPKAPQPIPAAAPAAPRQPAPRRQQNNYNNYQEPSHPPQYNPQPRYNAIPQQQPQQQYNQYQQPQQQQQKYQSPQGQAFSYSFGADDAQLQNSGFGSFNNNNNNNYNQNQYQQPQQQYNNFNSFQQTTSTTPAPRNFFPPGKLSLNRMSDGYQYSFSSM